MTAENSRNEIILNSKRNQENGALLSDKVIIEIVHAFKDIMIEFINKRYSNTK